MTLKWLIKYENWCINCKQIFIYLIINNIIQIKKSTHTLKKSVTFAQIQYKEELINKKLTI